MKLDKIQLEEICKRMELLKGMDGSPINPDEVEFVQKLLAVELTRRSKAGRKKTSNLTRKEQSRLAQQRFRSKHRLKAKRLKDLETRKATYVMQKSNKKRQEEKPFSRSGRKKGGKRTGFLPWFEKEKPSARAPLDQPDLW